jgi:3-oxoacyl-[acyl-carrier protein] reductase
MNIELNQQTAIVTGASRGIGNAILQTLGKCGATIIGTATSDKGVKTIENTLKKIGASGRGYVLNVADPASIEQFAKALSEGEINPEILVNNAGITRDNLVLRMKDEEWLEVINTDLNSIYRLCKICLKGMMKARYGRIINITSVVALSGNPGQANYSAAKAGIIGFTKSLAREVGSRNITVNAVAPGFISTDMTDALSEEQISTMLDQIALGRLGEAEEVANVVAFLASSQASYITGETININGGMYMA